MSTPQTPGPDAAERLEAALLARADGALGELDQARIDGLLATRPDLDARVTELRADCGELRRELRRRPAPQQLGELHRARIRIAASSGPAATGTDRHAHWSRVAAAVLIAGVLGGLGVAGLSLVERQAYHGHAAVDITTIDPPTSLSATPDFDSMVWETKGTSSSAGVYEPEASQGRGDENGWRETLLAEGRSPENPLTGPGTFRVQPHWSRPGEPQTGGGLVADAELSLRWDYTRPGGGAGGQPATDGRYGLYAAVPGEEPDRFHEQLKVGGEDTDGRRHTDDEPYTEYHRRRLDGAAGSTASLAFAATGTPQHNGLPLPTGHARQRAAVGDVLDQGRSLYDANPTPAAEVAHRERIFDGVTVTNEIHLPRAHELDLPVEELQTEDEVLAEQPVKGRAEADSVSEMGGPAAFLAIGAGGGGGVYGDRLAERGEQAGRSGWMGDRGRKVLETTDERVPGAAGEGEDDREIVQSRLAAEHDRNVAGIKKLGEEKIARLERGLQKQKEVDAGNVEGTHPYWLGGYWAESPTWKVPGGAGAASDAPTLGAELADGPGQEALFRAKRERALDNLALVAGSVAVQSRVQTEQGAASATSPSDSPQAAAARRLLAGGEGQLASQHRGEIGGEDHRLPSDHIRSDLLPQLDAEVVAQDWSELEVQRELAGLRGDIDLVLEKTAEKPASPPQAPATITPPLQVAPPVNPWVLTADDALSTFAMDVDQASLRIAADHIRRGVLPPAATVRMEEFVNAFDYHDADSDQTFTVHSELAPAPFGEADSHLLRIGVKGRVLGRDQQRPTHLVIVVDASGSMDREDRLPLVKRTLMTVLDGLGPQDRVSLLSYGGGERLLLEAVGVDERARIAAAIASLQANGSTNLLAGLRLGQGTAARHYRSGTINQVLLCSDGVANVGAIDLEQIGAEVDTWRRQGIACTTLGFGIGGYRDEVLERIANRGDGQYHFIDGAQAIAPVARRLADGFQTIARDAKIQVGFDAQRVRRFRLIGYENRALQHQQFRDDSVDAGEVGSGQAVTALYEVELHDARDRLTPLGEVRVRYRDVAADAIAEIGHPLDGDGGALSVESRPRWYLAACAAEFAELLRGSEHARDGSLAHVERLLAGVAAQLPHDDAVAELLRLVRASHGLPRTE